MNAAPTFAGGAIREVGTGGKGAMASAKVGEAEQPCRAGDETGEQACLPNTGTAGGNGNVARNKLTGVRQAGPEELDGEEIMHKQTNTACKYSLIPFITGPIYKLTCNFLHLNALYPRSPPGTHVYDERAHAERTLPGRFT